MTELAAAHRTLTRWLLAAQWRSHRGRALVAIATIALGVGLGYAVQLINSAAFNEFSAAARSLSGDADLQVRGATPLFDESLYPRLATREGVALASPVLEIDVSVPKQNAPLKVLGIDVFKARRIAPDLTGVPSAQAPFDVLADDALFLSTAAQQWLDARIGGTVTLQNGTSPVRLRVAGGIARARAGPAHRGDGHRRRAMAASGCSAACRASICDSRAASIANGSGGRCRMNSAAASWCRRRGHRKPHRPAFARLPDQHERARAGRAFHRRVPRVFDAGVGGRATPRAVRDAARARHDARAVAAADHARRRIARRARARCSASRSATRWRRLALRFFGSDLGGGYFPGVQPRVGFEPVASAVFLALGIGVALVGTLVPALEAARARPRRRSRPAARKPRSRRSRRPGPRWRASQPARH